MNTRPRPTDSELRECLATVIERVGTDAARRLADDVRGDRVSDDIIAQAKMLDLDLNTFIKDFRDEVHETTGHSITPVGSLN